MAREKTVIVDPEKIEWETVERALERLGRANEVARAPEEVKKAWVKVLSHDEETGAIAGFAKFDKGHHESKHTHPSDNFFTVLEGKMVDGKGNEIKKGMYCFTPAGVEHGPYDAPKAVFSSFTSVVGYGSREKSCRIARALKCPLWLLEPY